MKSIFILSVFLLGIYGISLAQSTPNCTSISGYSTYPAPLTQAQINSINSQQQSQFPNAVKLEEPTSAYNCHNYAWVKSTGGSTFWLNTPGDDAFWNDGSYTATSYIGQADYRVSYQGDHSAVTTSVMNQCISKWGSWGLYRHNTTYVPAGYLPSNPLTYYKRTPPVITGPAVLCTTGQYTLTNYPSGYPISWSVSPTGSVSPSSGTGNTANLTRLNAEDVTITFTLAGCNSTSRVIFVGPPQFGGFLVNGNSTSNGSACVNSYTPIAAVPNDPSATYSWSQSDPNGFIANSSSSSTAFTAYNANCYYLNVNIWNTCGSTNQTLTICTNNCFARYTVFPNPAKDYITIDFDQIESANSLPDEIVLLSEKTTQAVKSIDVQSLYLRKGLKNGKQIEIEAKDLPRGIYYLHIKNSRLEEKKLDVIRILLD